MCKIQKGVTDTVNEERTQYWKVLTWRVEEELMLYLVTLSSELCCRKDQKKKQQKTLHEIL